MNDMIIELLNQSQESAAILVLKFCYLEFQIDFLLNKSLDSATLNNCFLFIK